MVEAGVIGTSYAASHRIGSIADRTHAGEDPMHPGFLPESASTHSRGDTPKIKVLIADDEVLIANTLVVILNSSGFEACAVYSGEAAVQVLGAFQPDVLISDVIMTGMSGIDTAIAVRSLRPTCKILLFSGQAATTDLLQRARMLGHHFEILTKPVHPLDLLAKLRMECAAQSL